MLGRLWSMLSAIPATLDSYQFADQQKTWLLLCCETPMEGCFLGKMYGFGLTTLLCNWILDFFDQRLTVCQTWQIYFIHFICKHQGPPGLHDSPLTLFTSDCSPSCPTNYTMKFADDTEVFGLITNNETACRKEDEDLAAWCSNHNVAREILADYWPLDKGDEVVERVINLKFLGLTMTKPL